MAHNKSNNKNPLQLPLCPEQLSHSNYFNYFDCVYGTFACRFLNSFQLMMVQLAFFPTWPCWESEADSVATVISDFVLSQASGVQCRNLAAETRTVASAAAGSLPRAWGSVWCWASGAHSMPLHPRIVSTAGLWSGHKWEEQVLLPHFSILSGLLCLVPAMGRVCATFISLSSLLSCPDFPL